MAAFGSVLTLAAMTLVACDGYKPVEGVPLEVKERRFRITSSEWRDGRYAVFGEELFWVLEQDNLVTLALIGGVEREIIGSVAVGGLKKPLELSNLVRSDAGDIFVAVSDAREHGAVLRFSPVDGGNSVWWKGKIGDWPRLHYAAELNQVVLDDRYNYTFIDQGGKTAISGRTPYHTDSAIHGSKLILNVAEGLQSFPDSEALEVKIDRSGLHWRTLAQSDDTLVATLVDPGKPDYYYLALLSTDSFFERVFRLSQGYWQVAGLGPLAVIWGPEQLVFYIVDEDRIYTVRRERAFQGMEIVSGATSATIVVLDNEGYSKVVIPALQDRQ